ncbi:gliding motility-associated C-terminal domain-containing protein [Flavobacteriales bacterium]|nr:gliding motility-associated C-terminal domain-containing protein [Flavobacteriales bacterium]
MQHIKHILKKLLLLLSFVWFYGVEAQNPFIENQGQLPSYVISKTHLPSGALFIERAKFTYAFYNGQQLKEKHDRQSRQENIDAHAYSVSFLNSNNNSSSRLIEQSTFYENYFIGEKKNWVTKVRSYKTHLQKDIYSGVDLLLFVVNDQLKFEIHIAPNNNNTKSIKLKYEGLDKLEIIDKDIFCKTSVNTIKEHQPYAYQIINGKTIEVQCYYKLDKDVISFVFPNEYDKNYKLVIDPVLEFSTYSGSTADNFGYTATYDNFGFLYSGSTVFGVGYPHTLGAYDITYNNTIGGTDVAITKYDTSGTQRIYSTYLGGSKDELPHSMIVNSADELFIFGTTASSDFPTTLSAYQTTFKGGVGFAPSGIGVNFPDGSDIFVSRLSANGGNLLASTFIGGTGNDGLNIAPKLKYNYADEVRGEIDIDKNNNIYIATCTQSSDFPITNSFQNNSNGNQEGCIVKMDNQLTSIIWSSYLGGINDDAIYSLALDDEDNIYVTGGTNSADFPTTTNAYLTNYQDSTKADAFISKIASNGNQLMYSSYYGTDQYDQSYFVEIGSNNSIYLFGQTKTSGTNLVSNATYFESGAGQFIAVFSEDLSSVLRSTVVGTGKGTPDISPTAFLVDVCDKIYISGWGSNLGGPLSTLNLAVSTNAFQSSTDGNDFYLMVIDDAMSNMLYATYFGGSQSNEHVDGGTSRFDKKGIIYQSVCAGCGGHSDFPIEPNPGAVSATNNSSNCNNGVFKFNFDFPMVVADFNAPWVGCDPTISFQNLSTFTSAANYQWNFGDGSISNVQNPTHNFTQTGQYNITLIVTDAGSCNISDTIIKQIYILSNSKDTIQGLTKCIDEQIQIGLLPVNDPTINYFWFPSGTLSSANVSNPISSTTIPTEYQLLISNGGCTDTLLQMINVIDFQIDAGTDTSYCNVPIQLTASSTSNTTSILWSTNTDFTDTLSQSSNLIVTSIGIFYVKVSNGLCDQIDSVEVKAESLKISLFANDTCKGGSVFVGVTNQNPIIPIVSYNWHSLLSDSSSIIDFPDSSRWYSVEVENIEGCILNDSIFVNVYENPTIDSLWLNKEIIFQGEQVIVNIQTNDFVDWIGYNNSNLTLEDYPKNNNCYNVEVYNQFNCLIADSICITVLDVFCNEDSILIPTAFSPNEDENLLNETYFIEDNAGVITDFNLEIFNRLGQKVFSTTNINIKWDGTYRGEKLSPQVLDFYLELRCIGDKQLFKKGNITLIR